MIQIIMSVNLSAIDLNLFLVLHAVLEERSATRAAARLHVTQSDAHPRAFEFESHELDVRQLIFEVEDPQRIGVFARRLRPVGHNPISVPAQKRR